MIDQVKTPISNIQEKLFGYKAFEELHANCKMFLINPDTCGRMKECLQQMINEGLVQIGYMRKLEDVSAIEYHGHTPFEIPYFHTLILPLRFHLSYHLHFKQDHKHDILLAFTSGGLPLREIIKHHLCFLLPFFLLVF